MQSIRAQSPRPLRRPSAQRSRKPPELPRRSVSPHGLRLTPFLTNSFVRWGDPTPRSCVRFFLMARRGLAYTSRWRTRAPSTRASARSIVSHSCPLRKRRVPTPSIGWCSSLRDISSERLRARGLSAPSPRSTVYFPVGTSKLGSGAISFYRTPAPRWLLYLTTSPFCRQLTSRIGAPYICASEERMPKPSRLQGEPSQFARNCLVGKIST